ncbi:MAG: flagellar basal body rod protein FlgC [Holophaga sp.]|nr:flagellar basal body rod protein FlgC [Holophaga sp.]
MSFNRINDIAASGMAAQRLRVQLIAGNIANSETTRTEDGGPFKKKEAVFKVLPMGTNALGQPFSGVRVAEVATSKDPFISKFEPNHPDANAEGVVLYPNVSPVEEMVDLTEASRAFEANVAVVRAARAMSLSAQDLLRVT